jgi:hypothetical protein
MFLLKMLAGGKEINEWQYIWQCPQSMQDAIRLQNSLHSAEAGFGCYPHVIE